MRATPCTCRRCSGARGVDRRPGRRARAPHARRAGPRHGVPQPAPAPMTQPRRGLRRGSRLRGPAHLLTRRNSTTEQDRDLGVGGELGRRAPQQDLGEARATGAHHQQVIAALHGQALQRLGRAAGQQQQLGDARTVPVEATRLRRQPGPNPLRLPLQLRVRLSLPPVVLHRGVQVGYGGQREPPEPRAEQVQHGGERGGGLRGAVHADQHVHRAPARHACMHQPRPVHAAVFGGRDERHDSGPSVCQAATRRTGRARGGP